MEEEIHRGPGKGASDPGDGSSQLSRSRLATLGDLYLLYVNDADLVFLQETTQEQNEICRVCSSPRVCLIQKKDFWIHQKTQLSAVGTNGWVLKDLVLAPILSLSFK